MSEHWFHKKDDEIVESTVTETPVAPETPETPVTPETPESVEAPKAAPRPEPEEILKRIDLIQGDTAYLHESMERIFGLDRGEETKICAIKDMVMARETTNQSMISLLERMYKDQRIVINTPDMEWVGKISRGAEETARKAGRAAKDWAGKTRDWFRDLSEENWEDTVREQARKITGRPDPRTLREKVLDALRDPAIDEESRELILEYMGKLKDLTAEMQDQALDILTDPSMEAGDKERILENLEAINQL